MQGQVRHVFHTSDRTHFKLPPRPQKGRSLIGYGNMLANCEGLGREKKMEEHSDSTVGQKVLEQVKGDPKRQDTDFYAQE